MKKLVMAALAVCVLSVTGCGGGAGNDPKSTLVAFFDAMSKKDFTAAKKLATKDSEAMFSMMEMAMKMGGDKDTDMNKFDKAKMEFGDAKIEGDKATISVKQKGESESVNFPLKKEGGDWKVAFDKSLMTSNMDKIKDKMDADSLSGNIKEGIDKLSNMNMDSIKNAASEGLKALDTVKDMLEKLKK
jgi:predicted small secreted protein